MVHNTNIRARAKKKAVRESDYDKEEKLTLVIISLIKARGMFSDFQIKQTLKLTFGVWERQMRLIKNNYQDEVSWNKKTRMFTRVEELKQEIKNEL